MKAAVTMLVACVSALLSLGIVMLYSSKMGQHGEHFLLMQLAWCGLGLIGCALAACLDYNHLKKISWVLILLSIFLLVIVLIPISGVTGKINGAYRWIRFGSVGFQPSEIAKVSLIIALAHYGERYQRFMPAFFRGLLVPGSLIALILGLIFLEPDWGSTILLAAVSAAMLLLAGLRWFYVIPPVLAGAAGLAYLLINNPMRLKRVMAWLNPELHREGVAYQPYQAMLALGSGGWQGLGLGNGRQKLGFVPEHHTDFIFSVIGEELGLVATLGILVAFVLILLSGVTIAWHSRNVFGFLLGAGLTLLISLQAFINIGVVTSVLPNKGLSLPFISYGGSNLVVMLTSVGLLLSIARQAGKNAGFLFNPEISTFRMS